MDSGLVKLTILLWVTAMAAACSSNDDNSAGRAYSYLGEWETGCVEHPVQPNLYFTYRLRFDASEWQHVFAAYVDEACSSQRLETSTIDRKTYTTTTTGTYVNSDTVTTADGLQASKIVMTATSITSTSDNPIDESGLGTSVDVLVYVDDANVLYAGESLIGTFDDSEPSENLVLTLPFSAVE